MARDRLIEVLKRMDDGVYASLNDQADAVISALILQPKDPAEVGAEVASAARALLDACYKADENSDLSDFVDGMLLTRLDKALLARSSAPEARGEALGNLLAVIHGDGGHRALEVGVEQAAAEAEKIVARLLSSAPEAREVLERIREMDFKAIYGEANYQKLADDLDALYTHPAAPSADKLRDVLVDLTSWFTKPVQGQSGMVWVIPAGERGADDALNAALAALKAEPTT